MFKLEILGPFMSFSIALILYVFDLLDPEYFWGITAGAAVFFTAFLAKKHSELEK